MLEAARYIATLLAFSWIGRTQGPGSPLLWKENSSDQQQGRVPSDLQGLLSDFAETDVLFEISGLGFLEGQVFISFFSVEVSHAS
jgi:hypothetical protein